MSIAPRANWKGYLRLSLVSCPIALYPASSLSEKVSFNDSQIHVVLTESSRFAVLSFYISVLNEYDVVPADWCGLIAA
jgi:hypothetical protein